MNKRVIFIATHPDDETMGCGGSILKIKANGDAIFWLIITCAYEKDGFSKEAIENMKGQISKVSSMYGFNETIELKFPTTLLDTIPIKNIVAAIASTIQEVKPDSMYVPFRNDIHSDHGIVFKAAFSCTKSFRFPFIKEVYAYETISETEFSPPLLGEGFNPNTFCDITDHFQKKLEIMSRYKSESQSAPFPRSKENITALATFRGATIGVKYAEAFLCLKRII